MADWCSGQKGAVTAYISAEHNYLHFLSPGCLIKCSFELFHPKKVIRFLLIYLHVMLALASVVVGFRAGFLISTSNLGDVLEKPNSSS